LAFSRQGVDISTPILGCSVVLTTFNFDSAGNLLNFTQPNGVVTTYSVYDTLNRLKQINSVKGSTTLASFAYTLFPAGNRQMATDLSGRTATYGYDNDYRLTSEAIASDPGGVNGTVGYTLYDAANNRKTMTSTLSAIGAGSFSYDANDRLTTDTYDANGNTISSAGITRTYDFENHLTGTALWSSRTMATATGCRRPSAG
jgi:YD repeat-containing protein